MRLTLENVDEVSKVVRRELAAKAVRLGTVATCTDIMQSITLGGTQADPRDILVQIFRIIWFLEHATKDVNASHKSGTELTRVAEYSLSILGIKPYKSKFSFLYRILYSARAQFLQQLNDPWLSVWSIKVGDAMDGSESTLSDEEQLKVLELEAQQYVRCGFIADAVALFHKAETFATTESAALPIRLQVVRCLRILNQTNLALDTLASLREQTSLTADLHQAVSWEYALLTAQRDRDLTLLLELIEQETEHPETIHTEYLPLAVLWCYASKQRAAIDKLPTASWLKSHLGTLKDARPGISPIKLISHIEDFYSTGSPIFQKLKDAGEVLGALRSEPVSVELVVFYAAAARCLLRNKQKPTAALALNIHQWLSSAMSSGRTQSLFGLMDDVGDSLNATADSSRSETIPSGIKTGLERTFLYLEIMAKLFMMAVVAKTKKFSTEADEQAYKRELLVKLSQFFVKYASGAMKGPIHKLGQALLNLLNLPEDAQANFRSVLWSKTIVPENLMRRVLEDELEQNVDNVFAKFDWNPIGVGSVSQVYRAQLQTGEQVAVKIQFPDLAKVVQQDLTMFARILTAVRWMFPRNDLSAISKFLLEIYQRETNFLTELEAAKVLNLISSRGARWRIPKFFAHLCSQRVLVSELIEGINFYEFSETASSEEKIEVARALHQFANLSILEGQMICFDPHPANLIVSEGQVVMIDFGCFVPLTPDFVAVAREISLSYLLEGEQRLNRQIEIYRQAGVLKSHPSVVEGDIQEFLTLLTHQFNWETCTHPDLQSRFNELYLKRGINKIFGSNKPEFALGFIAQILMIRTINKFGVPRSLSTLRSIAIETEARLRETDFDEQKSQELPSAG